MKKVVLCANRDFVLYNFRFELLQRLIKEHYDVYIVLPYGPKVDFMKAIGCTFIPIEIDGRGSNIFNDIKTIRVFNSILKKINPDIILTYTTKVCIYAGIVAGKRKIKYIENISGLGTAVETKNVLQPFMIKLYRLAVKHASCVFFQNDENERFFIEHNISCKKRVRIPGSGVNLQKWKYLEYPEGDKIHFAFIARIIKEKGIEQYLSVAEKTKKKYKNIVFHVIGPCDGDYQSLLDQKVKEGIIEYHGMIQDTSEYLRIVHCLIHPSYYPEGISNVLLEASASGRPIITTDRSGCREVVEDGKTGYMVKCKDEQSLLEAVEKFIELPWEMKEEMGKCARRKVENEFDRRIVIEKYMTEIARNIS